MYQETKQAIQAIAGNEYLYFETPLRVRLTPHSKTVEAWATCVSPKGDIYLMNADEEWAQIEPSESLSDPVIGTLYQRVKLIEKKKKEN